MNKNTIIKLILLIFFIIFFGFLFYYFYSPTIKQNSENNKNNSSEEETPLFPFINDLIGGDNNSENSNSENNNSISEKEKQKEKENKKEEIPRLRQISKIPTASAYIEKISKTEIFDINKGRDRELKLDLDGEYSEIRYISTKNNHLYRTYDFTLQDQRISNITIPKIFEALFFDKNNYIVRYINDYGDIKSYSIKISDKTKEEIEEEKQNNPDSDNYKLKKFEGIFLPDNIVDIAINTIKRNIFYIKDNEEKKSEIKIKGIVATKDAENKKEIFRSELKEWNFNFNSPNFILATTKPAGTTGSYSMSVNTKTASTKAQSKIKTALNGLPNYNFTKILYSYKKDKQYVLYVKDIKTQEEIIIKGIKSIIDKCVWSKNNIDIYCATTTEILKDDLENWYKGKKYLDNNGIYKINSKTGASNYIFESKNYNKNFDIIDLKIDNLEKYLYFKDKKTDFYWSYKIKEEVKEVKEEESDKKTNQ